MLGLHGELFVDAPFRASAKYCFVEIEERGDFDEEAKPRSGATDPAGIRAMVTSRTAPGRALSESVSVGRLNQN